MDIGNALEVQKLDPDQENFRKKDTPSFSKNIKSNGRLCFGASKSHDASAHEALNKSGRSKKSIKIIIHRRQ